MSGFHRLEVMAEGGPVRLTGFAADFGEPAGAEVLVVYGTEGGAPGTAGVHVYDREIAEGALSCSLSRRRAAVVMDLGFLARVLADGLRSGIPVPRDEIERLRAALAPAE